MSMINLTYARLGSRWGLVGDSHVKLSPGYGEFAKHKGSLHFCNVSQHSRKEFGVNFLTNPHLACVVEDFYI